MHLGTSMYMLGSLLYRLVFQVLGGPLQANMEQVWSGVVDYYTQRQVEAQFTNLEVGSFHHAGNSPKLSGKGAEVKDLVPALRHVWQEHCIPSLRHHMLVQTMLQINVKSKIFLHITKARWCCQMFAQNHGPPRC